MSAALHHPFTTTRQFCSLPSVALSQKCAEALRQFYEMGTHERQYPSRTHTHALNLRPEDFESLSAHEIILV